MREIEVEGDKEKEGVVCPQIARREITNVFSQGWDKAYFIKQRKIILRRMG